LFLLRFIYPLEVELREQRADAEGIL